MAIMNRHTPNSELRPTIPSALQLATVLTGTTVVDVGRTIASVVVYVVAHVEIFM